MKLNVFALFMIPALLAVLSYLLKPTTGTRKFIAVGYWLHLALAAFLFLPVLNGKTDLLIYNQDITIDRLGVYFVLLTIFVVACCVTQADCFFAGAQKNQPGTVEDFDLRIFYVFVGLFLLSMCAVFICNNLGFLWMSIEATTLFSAPLVYFERTKHALEATWKYLVICSVGIALALLGTVFFFAASQHGAMAGGTLNIKLLIDYAQQLDYPLMRLGFIFCLLGYGTKAGIFPLHSWLPDAHSEAPAPASAMLSGALLNCALFSIWRICQIVGASRHENLIGQMVVFLGMVTVIAAALFLIRQHNFKRMWAYSSIENVGIMLVAIGLGSGSLYFLQALNHSLAKVALFLLSGNIVQACGTKRLRYLHGILKVSPLWGCLLALATFAAIGGPPFGSFVSELAILTASADMGNWILATALVIGIAIAFVALSTHVGRILFGGAKAKFFPFATVRASLIPAILVAGSLIMGVIINPHFWMYFK